MELYKGMSGLGFWIWGYLFGLMIKILSDLNYLMAWELWLSNSVDV